MLRFEGITRVHGTGPKAVRALGPVTFDVPRGELVAIMGPSGSGKSTLLALAGALDQPSEGRVLVDNNDLATLAPAALAALRRQTIGFVFQDLNLLPGLSAIENVALPLDLDGVASSESRRLANEALEGVRMSALAHRFPDDLSGGEQQRVAIARAFVGPRGLLLADEPTGALDSATGEIVMRLLRAQCDRGRTVVLVTHDPAHVRWADRVLHLRDGLMVDEVAEVERSTEAATVGVSA
ncbi:MAG: ABC transporter ATP-binding protein [Candidatus Eisenbacteria bacterium]|uniref:ABC transporter ATP-binding protein n=1 Tax=Eiseniibacteriota bacterium TaxID=2212470 RepID=A0A849SJH2_UNCEI|nr:ABC transporter ATP-binding protein [Candidatus Eisenbacteria bacterium]